MRVLCSIVFVAACAHPQPNVAVTIAGPAASVSTEAVDHTQERITAAKEDIAAEHWDAASHALLAIVCGDREIRGNDDLARCPAAPFVNTSEAWGLIGELALKGKLALASNELIAAQRLVVRWSESKSEGELDLAEVALTHAVRQSGSVKYAFTLATTRRKLRKWGPALDAFVKVLASPSDTHHKEAIDGAVESITYGDWNADGEDDDVIGFGRPEVQAALGNSKEPWIAELYTRAIQSFLDADACAAARLGVYQLGQRFTTHPALSRLQIAAQACHP